MTIYIVRSGDTLTNVANMFGVDILNLAADNGLEVNSELVVGQALAIQIPEIVHTVLRGETITSIAKSYGTTAINLLRNNFRLGGNSRLSVGERIIISYKEDNIKRSISVNSYAYPYVENNLLREQMP